MGISIHRLIGDVPLESEPGFSCYESFCQFSTRYNNILWERGMGYVQSSHVPVMPPIPVPLRVFRLPGHVQKLRPAHCPSAGSVPGKWPPSRDCVDACTSPISISSRSQPLEKASTQCVPRCQLRIPSPQSRRAMSRWLTVPASQCNTRGSRNRRDSHLQICTDRLCSPAVVSIPRHRCPPVPFRCCYRRRPNRLSRFGCCPRNFPARFEAALTSLRRAKKMGFSSEVGIAAPYPQPQ